MANANKAMSKRRRSCRNEPSEQRTESGADKKGRDDLAPLKAAGQSDGGKEHLQ